MHPQSAAAAAAAAAAAGVPVPPQPAIKRRWLSDEQRCSILVLQAAGHTPAEIGRLLGVQSGTVRQHLSRIRKGGNLMRSTQPHTGGRPKLSDEQLAAIEAAAEALQPGPTSAQVAAAAAACEGAFAEGKGPSQRAVARVLKDAGYTRKRLHGGRAGGAAAAAMAVASGSGSNDDDEQKEDDDGGSDEENEEEEKEEAVRAGHDGGAAAAADSHHHPNVPPSKAADGRVFGWFKAKPRVP
jgi:transposase